MTFSYRGVSDVCLSVRCIVNRTGMEIALPVPMNPAEEAGLQHSAEIVRAALTGIGF